MSQWWNCWAHLSAHQWEPWERDDTWLNMYPYHDPPPTGIMSRRCRRCIYIQLRELFEKAGAP